MPAIPVVFLLVISRTHYRTMAAVADLLHASGDFAPHLVYYPSRVFDENFLGCASKPYPAHLFSARAFRRPDGSAEGAPPAGSPGPAPGRLVDALRHRAGVLRLKIRRALPQARGPALRRRLQALASASWSCLEAKYRGRDEPWRRELLVQEWAAVLCADRPAEEGRRWCEDLLGLLDEQVTVHLAFRALLERERPAIFVMPEENILYNGHAFVRACMDAGVASMVVPFTISDQKELLGGMYHFPPAHADAGPVARVADAFPEWSRFHRGRRLVIPAPYLLGCDHLGVAYDDPWLINSGPSDVVTADSELMRRYYERAGVRPGKVRYVGALADDVVHAALARVDERRREQIEAAGAPHARRLVLVAIPPDMFARDHAHLEFHSHEEIVRFMLTALRAACSADDVLVASLHPNIGPEAAGWVRELGVPVLDGPVERAIPVSNLFVAVASATIRCAISAGVPVVNFDAFRFDYDDYRDLPGVICVKTRDEFESTLARVIGEAGGLDAARAAQTRAAETLYRVDGRAHARMLDLMRELASRAQGRQPAW